MERKIKGLRKASFIVGILVLAVIGISFMNKEISLELGIIGSIITFIYGFFMNSLFNFIEDKYVRFKSNISALSANIQSLYNLVMLYNNKAFKANIKRALVEFIKSIKTLRPENYHRNQESINKIFQTFRAFKIKSKEDANIHYVGLTLLSSISINREELEVFGQKYLIREMKLLFISFPVLLAMVILTVTRYNFYIMLIGVLLILVLISTAYLLMDMDNLTYGEYKISKENLDQLMEFISKK